MDLRRTSDALTLEQKLDVVSLAEAKAQERVLHDFEDALIRGYIEAAFDWLHGPLGWLNGYCLLQETFALFPGSIGNTLELPVRPVEDEDAVVVARRLGLGSYTTLAPGSVMASRVDEIGSVALARLTNVGFQPQSNVADPREYRVTFTAGHEKPEDVPSPLKQAILLLVGHFYQNREASVADPRQAAVSKKVQFGLMDLAGRYRVSPDHS